MSNTSYPLVSIIVPTYNSNATLENCLRSVANQSYKSIELIVVDNNSTDTTKAIAARYTSHVFDKGPERSAQRNFGASKASGSHVLFIDSDMELSPQVVKACVLRAQSEPSAKAIIVPEESFGEGFWAKCKSLERSYYVGQDTIEAARFFDMVTFKKSGGYSEEMTGGEDWDLTRRVRALTSIVRVSELIRHNEGRLYFSKTINKMYYYAQHAVEYFAKNPTTSALTDESGPLARYKLFFSKPGKLFKNPTVGLGMLTLKTAEYVAGGLGYAKARFVKRVQA